MFYCLLCFSHEPSLWSFFFHLQHPLSKIYPLSLLWTSPNQTPANLVSKTIQPNLSLCIYSFLIWSLMSQQPPAWPPVSTHSTLPAPSSSPLLCTFLLLCIDETHLTQLHYFCSLSFKHVIYLASADFSIPPPFLYSQITVLSLNITVLLCNLNCQQRLRANP